MNEAFCLGPESQSDAIPFKGCQNCSNVSDGIWFPEKNVNRSNVRFRFVSYFSMQFFRISSNEISAMFGVGNLSVNVFPARPHR